MLAVWSLCSAAGSRSCVSWCDRASVQSFGCCLGFGVSGAGIGVGSMVAGVGG